MIIFLCVPLPAFPSGNSVRYGRQDTQPSTQDTSTMSETFVSTVCCGKSRGFSATIIFFVVKRKNECFAE